MRWENIKSLATQIVGRLDNNELAQLVEILDEAPDEFADEVCTIAKPRIPEIFPPEEK